MNSEENIKELEQRIDGVTRTLKEIVDFSISIRTDKEMKKKVAGIWQQFLGDFFGYIRQRSKEQGENLLAGIAFPRFWR